MKKRELGKLSFSKISTICCTLVFYISALESEHVIFNHFNMILVKQNIVIIIILSLEYYKFYCLLKTTIRYSVIVVRL